MLNNIIEVKKLAESIMQKTKITLNHLEHMMLDFERFAECSLAIRKFN